MSARAPNTPHNRFVRRLLYTTAEYQPTGIPLRNQSCLPMMHKMHTGYSSPSLSLLLVRLAFTVCGLIIACCPWFQFGSQCFPCYRSQFRPTFSRESLRWRGHIAIVWRPQSRKGLSTRAILTLWMTTFIMFTVSTCHLVLQWIGELDTILGELRDPDNERKNAPYSANIYLPVINVSFLVSSVLALVDDFCSTRWAMPLYSGGYGSCGNATWKSWYFLCSLPWDPLVGS